MPVTDTPDLTTSERIKTLVQQNEQVLLTAASDVSAAGDYGPHWLVVTDRRVFTVGSGNPGGNGSASTAMPAPDGYRSVWLEDITEAKTEPHVGGGRLEVYAGNVPVPLVEFSSSFGPKFAEVARSIQQLAKGNPFRVSEDVPELRCRRCGRLLVDRDAPCARCVRKSAILLRLMTYLKPMVTLSAILGLVTAGKTAAQLVPPYLQKLIIDGVLTGPPELKPHYGDYGFLVLLVLGTAAAGLLAALLQIAGAWMSAIVGTRVTRAIRGDLYRALERLSLSFHNRREQGALMSLVTRDTDSLNYFLIEGLPYLVTNSLMLVAIAGILFSMNWQLTLWVLLPAPFVVLGGGLLFGKMRHIWNRWSHSWAMFTAHLGESIAGIRVAKAFHQENAEISRFDARNEDLARITIREGRVWGSTFAILNFVTGIGVYLAWIIGGRAVIGGTMTLGEIVAFIGYLWLLYGPLQWFNQIYQWMSRALAGAERIFEVIDTPTERFDDSQAIWIDRIKGEIEFRDVTFGYDKAKPVLKDVSLYVHPGEMIGLVGKSGAGKSTFINLICRFYEADHGEVFIDGYNVKDISLDCLREQVGVVLQEPFLFNGTIADNIRYARPDATEQEVIAAARAANAHEFVVGKPDGYDTHVGEKGTRLSVGEKQRISIARAILRDPRILILDEATASVDTETEKAIQEALQRLVRGRTTFAIAHRLSTLRNADRLVVFEDGKIVEVGTHEELLERHGVYWKLVDMQMQVNKLRTVVTAE